MYMYIYIHLYIYICIYVFMYIYIYIYTYLYIYTCMHIYIYMYTHMHLYIYMHIYIYIYAYAHTYPVRYITIDTCISRYKHKSGERDIYIYIRLQSNQPYTQTYKCMRLCPWSQTYERNGSLHPSRHISLYYIRREHAFAHACQASWVARAWGGSPYTYICVALVPGKLIAHTWGVATSDEARPELLAVGGELLAALTG